MRLLSINFSFSALLVAGYFIRCLADQAACG
jgi:hypothetical protein